MKRFLFAFVLICVISGAVYGDVVLLKNGGRLEGVVITEKSDYIILKMGRGKLRLERKKIRKILKRSTGTNEKLKKDMEDEQKRLDEEAKKQPKEAAKVAPAAGKKPRVGKVSLEDLKGQLAAKESEVKKGALSFKMFLPHGWKAAGSPQKNVLLLAQRPVEPAADIQIMTITTRGGTIGTLRGRLKELVLESFPKATIRRSLVHTVSGVNAITYEAEYKQKGKKFRLTTTFVETGLQAKFVLVYRTQEEHWGKFDRVFKKSRGSFRRTS